MNDRNTEPLWVGMDVDAELARYAGEDCRLVQSETLAPGCQKRPSRRRGLRAAIPMLGGGGLPQFPLTA